MAHRRSKPDRFTGAARLRRVAAAAALALGAWPAAAGAEEGAEPPDSAAAAASRPVGPPSPPEPRSEAWVRGFYAPVLRVAPDLLGGPAGESGAADTEPDPAPPGEPEDVR